MGKKKKAILKFKRDGNLGKYMSKFSSLLKFAKPKVETIDDEEDQSALTKEEKAPESKPTPLKPKTSKKARKPTTSKKTVAKKKPSTTRKRRQTTTKADS